MKPDGYTIHMIGRDMRNGRNVWDCTTETENKTTASLLYIPDQGLGGMVSTEEYLKGLWFKKIYAQVFRIANIINIHPMSISRKTQPVLPILYTWYYSDRPIKSRSCKEDKIK